MTDQPQVARVADVVLVTPDAIRAEFGLLEHEVQGLLSSLGVPVTRLGQHSWVSLRAFADALRHKVDPACSPDDVARWLPVFQGGTRAAILEGLNRVGRELFPDVRYKKRNRQSQRGVRTRGPATD